ncbi:hypothetical protein R4172_09805 [Rhodococcus kroppenstedtii]|uniref:phage shock envelope stress response protein PspM n=1 Tax=Rhodococcoides kroppenstedtii TaxID=293050 RepID=UPI0029555E7C|nr:hypothetical protein [Rhodococcus kroppenstedtii]MDV7197858.1 hypothetical protein [Rhodococcus kroppenstedtii]
MRERLQGRAATVARAAGPLIESARTWNDPRRRAERKIRRTRRRATFFGAASGSSAVGTAMVAVAAAPEWVIVGGAGATALLAVPSVAALAAYRRLRGEPLPAARPAPRALPPYGSAAREPIDRLRRSEQSLHELLGIVSRSGTVAEDDVQDTSRIAAAAAASLTAAADDVVAMERAAEGSEAAAAHLRFAIASTAARLRDGVEQYDGLVAAAALLTAPASGSAAGPASRRDALQFATDRLEGWAYGLDRLDRSNRP